MLLRTEEYVREYAGSQPNIRAQTWLNSVIKGKMRVRACSRPLMLQSSAIHRQSVFAFRACYTREEPSALQGIRRDSARCFAHIRGFKELEEDSSKHTVVVCIVNWLPVHEVDDESGLLLLRMVVEDIDMIPIQLLMAPVATQHIPC